MDRKRPRKPFSLAGSKEPVVRDKDNVAPKIKPPEQTHLHHPRLAPPGMSGIRPSLQQGYPRPLPPVSQARSEQERQGAAKRAFAPLVQRPNKDRGPER